MIQIENAVKHRPGEWMVRYRYRDQWDGTEKTGFACGRTKKEATREAELKHGDWSIFND